MANTEPNTLAGLRRVFNKSDLDVNKFVSKISKNGGAEILQTIADLNRITDEASSQMKKAIFNNFKLFIDASKAVTAIGAVMHQLDNQLVEQKRLCSALTEKSLFRDESLPVDESKRFSNIHNGFSSLLNSVDGVSNLVKDPSRQLLLEADAVEVNPNTFMKQGYFHLVVLSDYILVAKRQYDSFEMRRYKKQALYELENVMVTDVKASSFQRATPDLIQLLVFPDNRVFQMESVKAKRLLISTINEAKRIHLTGALGEKIELHDEEKAMVGSNGRVDSCLVEPDADEAALVVSRLSTAVDVTPEVDTLCLEALASTIPEIVDFIRRDQPSTTTANPVRVNPFHRDSLVSAKSSSDQGEDAWLWEMPEDVDVAVAVRDFSKAVRLISRARNRLAQLLPSTFFDTSSLSHTQQSNASAVVIGLTKLRDRIDARAATLSTVLQEELSRAADRHSASQSVHAAVIHLSELGKTVLALHLFLAYRSGVINSSLVRGVRQEGNQLVYLNRLSFVFHRGLVESVAEWNQVIEQLKRQPDFVGLDDIVTSKLCSWVLEETVRFCNQLRVVLIDSRSISFYAMACASERIHAHAKKATELIGVDIKSTIDNCLLKSWQRAVEEQGRVYEDAVKHRTPKENRQSVDSIDATVKTMSETGFPEAEKSLTDGRGGLVLFTTQATRPLSHFAHACARFDCAELNECFATTLAKMLRSDLNVYSRALAAAKTPEESKSIMANLHFFVYKVIPKVSATMNCAEHPAVMAVTKDFKKLLRGG